jgi:hypothetical protein
MAANWINQLSQINDEGVNRFEAPVCMAAIFSPEKKYLYKL